MLPVRHDGEPNVPIPHKAGRKATSGLLIASFALLLTSCTATQPSAAPPEVASRPAFVEPTNVGLTKLAAVKYHDSGDYMSELARAAAPANDWLRQRAPQVSRPALVLDIDDTALTNWPVIVANDFGRFPAGPCLLPGGPCGWHAWDLRGQDAAIGPTLQVFQTARTLGVTVFFISGRPESERAATEKNLKAVGYAGYEQAFFTPNGAHFTSLVDFKAPTRQRIAGMGYTIIANIGDQMSDLDGSFAEKTFKLPNPFYYIP
jgi:predicted secreted acid phosphatase